MKNKATKFISIILSVLLIFSVMPMTALASDSVASVTTITGDVTEFSSLEEAIDFASANVASTLTLLSDAEVVDKEFHIIDCDFTLDLNGKTLSTTTAYEIIRIHRGGKLTIKDSVGTGVVTCADSDNNSNAVLHCGELIIEGGTFIGKDYAVVSCDKITVKDGTFIGDVRGLEIMRTSAVKFACSCFSDKWYGEYLNGSGQLLGGTFVNGITINNCGRWDDVFGPIYIADYIPEGYGFFAEDGTEVFVDIYDTGIPQTVTIKESFNERPNVAKVELATGTTEYFIDIHSAFYYAENMAWRVDNHNPKIVLLKDIELTGMVDFDGYNQNRTTLDLNGKTLSSSGGISLDVTRCTVIDSVGGGAIVNTAESKGTAIVCSSTVLDGVNIKSNSYSGVSVKNNTTINNCKIEGKTYGVLCNYKSSLNMNDCVLIGEEYGIYITELAKVNVDDCSFSGGTRGLYYHASSNSERPEICLSDCTIYGGMERARNNTQDFSHIVAEGFEIYDTEDNVIDVETRFPVNEYPHIVYEVDEDVVIKNKFPVAVVQPDGTTEYFPSVDEGLNSANKDFDSIFKLLTDILLSSTLTFKGTTTLDLNGKDIAIDDDYDYTVVVDDGASLNIEDSKENGTIGGGGVAVNGGTLNFNNGNIESSMDGIYNNGGDVTVNGGTISSEYGYDDIFVANEGTTKIYGGTYEDGFSIWGATINEALGEDYAFYTADGAVEIEDDQIEISENVVVYEKTIVTAMSSQIRFNKNDDGSYAGSFDVRTRAKITDADFKKYIAGSNEDATEKISKVGFVYSTAETVFDINTAKTVAQGGTADGFVDKPISYILDADGYYMFTCLVTGIPEEELDNGLTAYAYICIEDTWYFFPVEVTAEFGEMYNTYYPIAAEEYGWEV